MSGRDDPLEHPALLRHEGGDDIYAAPLGTAEEGVREPDPRAWDRLDADLAAGQVLDPLDMMDRATAELLWTQEGARLLAREDAVRTVATVNRWRCTTLDAQLSSRLVGVDITAGCPRITRNVCDPGHGGGALLTDLTGVTFHRDGTRPVDLTLRTGTAALIDFTSPHHLAVVPAGAQSSTWARFGDSVPTESAEFDERLRVHAMHPEWALLVLNLALMERLLEHQPITLIIAGGLLAVIRPGWTPASSLPDLKRFAEQVAFSAQAAATS